MSGEQESNIDPPRVDWVQSILGSQELPVLADVEENSKITAPQKATTPSGFVNTSLEDLEIFLDKAHLFQTITSFKYSELEPKLKSFTDEFAKYLEDLTTRDEQSSISKINYQFGYRLRSIAPEELSQEFFDITTTSLDRTLLTKIKNHIENCRYSPTQEDYEHIAKDLENLHNQINDLKNNRTTSKAVLLLNKIVEDEWDITIDEFNSEWVYDLLFYGIKKTRSAPPLPKVLDPEMLESYGEPKWKDLKWFITSMHKVWERHSRRVKKDMRLLELDLKKRFNAYIIENPEEETSIRHYLLSRLDITVEQLGENLIYTRLTKQARANLTKINPFKGQDKKTIGIVIMMLWPVPISLVIFGLTVSGLLDWVVNAT